MQREEDTVHPHCVGQEGEGRLTVPRRKQCDVVAFVYSVALIDINNVWELEWRERGRFCFFGLGRGCWAWHVNTTPQMTRLRGAKVCSKWLQERIDDHNIQSGYKCTIGLKV